MSTSVRLLRPVAGAFGVFGAGQVADLPAAVATAWIAAGVAELLPPAEPEAAAVAPPETAELPRPRRGGPRS